MSERVIVVSSDSHAGVPKELWPKYLDPEFHDLIPQLEEDNHVYPTVIALLSAKSGSTTGLPEQVEAHREGWHGLHDAVLRLADMDREGIAAELIFHGDARLGDLFHNATNREYPLEAWEAGAKAWNRWAADNFGFALDRFLLTGAVGPCVDMDAAVAEVHWLADHGFVGTYLPGYMRHPGMPPLYDPSWEPFWKACEDRGLVLVVHAGYGTRQGFVFPHLQRIYDAVADAAGSTDPEAMLAHSSAVSDDSLVFFDNFLSHNVDSRQPLWQLIMGGVFDRHPALRLFLTEIRLDWIPATLVHLDGVYEAHPRGFGARRKPSEYWGTSVVAGASFIHKVEVEMRHEIGLESILFGRDFPHPEGTWPHTREWLRDAFAGVPEDEVRSILGGNAVRFFGLDEVRLAEFAKRIGPTVEEINGGGMVAPELIESFAHRGGYLKAAEGEGKLPMVDELLREDLAALGVAS